MKGLGLLVSADAVRMREGEFSSSRESRCSQCSVLKMSTAHLLLSTATSHYTYALHEIADTLGTA